MYSEKFPEKLSGEEEKNYITKYKEYGDKNARDKLIRHNLRLVAYYVSHYNTKIYSREEMISEGMLGLIRGIEGYDPAKNVKLATYLGTCINHALITYTRKNSVRLSEVSLEEVQLQGEKSSSEDFVQEYVELRDMLGLLRDGLEDLPERQRELLRLRYGLGIKGEHKLTQKEIAERWGMSQSYISRMEKRILRQLRDKIE